MSRLLRQALVGEELALAFDDGVECYLSLPSLRRACPCAACQGEPDALGRAVRPVSAIGEQGFLLRKIDAVGGYALQLHWGDGHSTGIYTFGYLRRLAGTQSE